jgi:dienelactone hydrolase
MASYLKAHLSLAADTSVESAHARTACPLSHEDVETVYFDSHRVRCEAWLVRASATADSPLVIMAHGFGALKSFGLMEYARHFVDRGLAVMMFDYRHFGGSEGEPRNFISLNRQRQDWQSAVDFACTLSGIDRSRIALWGTSFSGGHALACAADNPNIAAVVAQAPMVDVAASFRGYSVGFGLKAIWHVARDLFQASMGRGPHCVPIVAAAPTFAVMNKQGCEAGYRRLVPQEVAWENACPARILLTSLFHRPGRKAYRVNCPVLLLLEAEDQLVPRRIVHQAAARMCDVSVVSLWGDHFDCYPGGASYERAVQLECDFLQRCLVKAQTLSIGAPQIEHEPAASRRRAA